MNAAMTWRIVASLSAVLFTGLALRAAWVETPTIDEFAHVPAGCRYLATSDFSLYSKNPPLLKMLMAAPVLAAGAKVPPDVIGSGPWMPWLYGYRFMEVNRADYLQLFFLARLIPIACTLLTALVLFAWARELVDERAAAATTSLFLLNPNVLAHGHLATIDAGCMFTVTLTLYALHWAYRWPGWARVSAAGLALGVALLVKFTAALLLPVVVGIVLMHRRPNWRRAAADFSLLFLVALVTVNIGMEFDRTCTPLGEFPLISQFCLTLQQLLPGWLPVPLPYDYFAGFDAQKLDTELGEFANYVLGAWNAESVWWYSPFALAVKSPVSWLVLLAVAPWFVRRSNWTRAQVAEIVLPLAVLFAMLALFNRLNIGLRYMLPLFPLLYLLTAAIWRGRSRWQPWAIGSVLALHAAGAVYHFPSYIDYFNPLAGGKSQGHKLLLDSNLDWGQDLYRLPKVLAELEVKEPIGLLYFGHVHPHLYGIDFYTPDKHPRQGVFAVSAHLFHGGSYLTPTADWKLAPVESNQAAWLRKFQPVAKAGSIWVFDTRQLASDSSPH